MTTEIACTNCGKQRTAKPAKQGGVKLPLGWKREGEAPVCRECWQQRYVLRALIFSVASPVLRSGADGERKPEWKELDAAIRPLWAEITEAANWMMTQCYVRDVRRGDAADAKMPPMPNIYLYPEARALFPNLAPTTVASLEQAVGRKYRAHRYEIVWIHKSTLPTLRYPQPLPVHNQSWKYWFNDQRQPMVEVRIGADKWHLRLKSGPRYYHQISGLNQMAERGELAIYKAHDGSLLVKLVGWLKREEKQQEDSNALPLIVRTGSDHLLAALDAKSERLWVENCDQLPRWISDHRRQLQRWQEDHKAEQRPTPSFAERRALAAGKYHRRMNSAIQEIAAHVANFAARRHYASVVYDDSLRWLEDFPYAALESRLKTSLDEKQIAFVKEAPKSTAKGTN